MAEDASESISETLAELSAASDEKFSESHLLVVDDNVQNLELLVAYLDSLNCKVSTAMDGIEALEKIRSGQFDLILLDIMMPRMSGFEVCRHRAQRGVRHGRLHLEAGQPPRTADPRQEFAAGAPPEEHAGTHTGLPE